MTVEAAIWHEVECGGYEADLPVWESLAGSHPGPVLDVGAGTGRVTLALAGQGHTITALDLDPVLLATLRERAQGNLLVTTVVADARSFLSPAEFGLVIVPMQTVQLFGGPEGRSRFFDCARRNLRAGGTVALAVADMSPGEVPLPASFEPDVMSVGDAVYASRPVCISEAAGTMVIERERTKTAGAGDPQRSSYSLEVDSLDAGAVEAEGRRAGLRPAGRLAIPAEGAYAGAEVVLLRG